MTNSDAATVATSPPAAVPLSLSWSSSQGDVAFHDSAGAQRWLKSLPLTSVSPVTSALLAQLHLMAELDYPARERARIAELFRDQVAHLHTELARRFAGKPQPGAERELEAADQAVGLWRALWLQYAACLKPLLEGDRDLSRVKAKLLQRGLYVGKQLVLVHGLARRPVPASVWHELHAYYRLAEILDCAGARVSDRLLPHAAAISCHSMYSHALLLALADPCALSVKQVELTDRWLQMWARKIFPHIKQQPTKGPVLLMDLEAGAGAALVSRLPQNPNESMRFGYPLRLAISVRARLRKLQGGAKPADLKLGNDCSNEQCTMLLSHLETKWCQLPRSHARKPTALVSLCGGGLAAMFFRLTGRAFDQTDSAAPASAYQGARGLYLQTVGAAGDDPTRDEAERAWGWEEWQGAYDRQEAVLTRVGPMRHRWFLDQLIVVRDPERIRIGHATRVAQDEDGQLHLSVRLFLSSPEPLSLRAVAGSSAEDLPFAAALLTGTPEEKPSLILPPRTYSQGRLLCSAEANGEKKYRLTCLLHRGGDFERVLFERAE